MPDLYQGCEFWDLSLVDPDNRRPVDFAARATALAGASDPADLMAHWRDGRLKQALIARILRLRRTLEPVFNDGDYLPLESEGLRAANVVAFVRRTERAAVLVAAPLRCAGALVGVDGLSPPADWWGDTRLVRPDELAGFVDDDGRPLAPSLRLGRMLFPFPVAIQALRAP
jgi:(1->4)-alpha-D-glucan 1-alpha-D-glucosylmutase